MARFNEDDHPREPDTKRFTDKTQGVTDDDLEEDAPTVVPLDALKGGMRNAITGDEGVSELRPAPRRVERIAEGDKRLHDPTALAATEGRYAGRPILDTDTTEGEREYNRIRERGIGFMRFKLREYLNITDADMMAENVVDDIILGARRTCVRHPDKAFTPEYVELAIKRVSLERIIHERTGCNVAYLRVGKHYLEKLARWRAGNNGVATQADRDRLWDQEAIRQFSDAAWRTISKGRDLTRNNYPRCEVPLSDGSSSDTAKTLSLPRLRAEFDRIVQRRGKPRGGMRRTYGKVNGRREFEGILKQLGSERSLDELVDKGLR